MARRVITFCAPVLMSLSVRYVKRISREPRHDRVLDVMEMGILQLDLNLKKYTTCTRGDKYKYPIPRVNTWDKYKYPIPRVHVGTSISHTYIGQYYSILYEGQV